MSASQPSVGAKTRTSSPEIGVAVPVPPGGARAGGSASVGVSVPVPPGGARAGGIPPAVILGPSAVLAYFAVAPPHPHLAAKHDDLVGYGIELALVVGVLFVGGKLVAGRIFRL